MKKKQKIKKQNSETKKKKPPFFKNFIEKIVELGPLFLLGVAPLVYLKMGGEFENNPKMALLQWGIAILVLIQALSFRKGKAFIWKRTPLDLPVTAFYCFCWISIINALNPYAATLSLLHFGAALIFYFFLVNTIKKEEFVDKVFFVISLSALVVSLIGIFQKLFDFSAVPQLTPPASTFANRNMASQFIAMAIPVIAGSILVTKEFKIRIISSICIIVSIVYLFFTRTRSAGMAVTAVFILMLIASLVSPGMKKYASIKKTVCIFMITAFAAGFLLFFQPAREALNLDNKVPSAAEVIKKFDKGSANLRFGWWKNTLEIINDNYWKGVGLGNFKLVYPAYYRASRVDRTFGENRQVNRVHNDHLQMLVELGFAGFCVYIWVFITFFYLFFKTTQKAKSRDTRLRAFFILLGGISFMIIACFTFPTERAVPPVLLFTYFALMAFLYINSSEEHTNNWCFSFQKTARIFTAAVIIVFLGSSFFFLRKIVLSDKYFVSGVTLAKKNRFEASNKSLRKAKTYSAWNFRITSLLALNYTRQKKYKEAIKEYEESFMANPNNVNGILNIGYCYLKIEDYDEAERYFNKYIAMIPDSPKVVNNLGIIYFSKKDYTRAEEYYKKSSELNETYAEPHYNLANLYMRQGEKNKAIKEYNRTLDLDPRMDDARKTLCDIYARSGNFEAAHKTVAPLLENKKSEGVGHVFKGDIYKRQGDNKRALFHYLKALQISPKNASAFHKAGLAHYHLKNYSEAETFLKKALSLNPNIPQTLNLLAQLYVMKKDDQSAKKLYEKVVKLNPKLVDAGFNLANIYLRSGMYREASVEYSRVLTIKPDFAPANFNLATILKRFGRNEEALFHFKNSIKKPSKKINAALAKKNIAELEAKLSVQ